MPPKRKRDQKVPETAEPADICFWCDKPVKNGQKAAYCDHVEHAEDVSRWVHIMCVILDPDVDPIEEERKIVALEFYHCPICTIPETDEDEEAMEETKEEQVEEI